MKSLHRMKSCIALATTRILSQSYLHVLIAIMVWNVEKGIEISFQEEFDTIAQGKHLILLQEFLGTNKIQQDLLQPFLEIQYDVATSFYYVKDSIRTGVATGSVAHPKRIVAYITNDVEPLIRTPKASIATWYSWYTASGKNATELLVINTHGINRASFHAYTRQIEDIASLISIHDGPVIWVGDFNTNTKKKRKWLLEIVIQKLHMVEVKFPGGDNRTRSKISGEPLDWIFVRDVTIENSWVLISTGSDHNPLFLTAIFP